ncbi:unnamed protein product [Pieris brassicae]|uniref:Ig-like domain-containing protein n=1 Tax=Pieris brassicae TaxID=7116 RepID=A0A9P0XEM1_PIEBR|nr:unnamed protein product [Pieris brassicae]
MLPLQCGSKITTGCPYILPPDLPRIYDSEGREITGNLAGPYREGQELKLTCQTPGGKPFPDITWYHGNERLSIARGSLNCQVEVDGQLTRSILTWRVRRENSGRELVCRVSNPWFPAYTLEDSIVLEVFYLLKLNTIMNKNLPCTLEEKCQLCFLLEE